MKLMEDFSPSPAARLAVVSRAFFGNTLYRRWVLAVGRVRSCFGIVMGFNMGLTWKLP